MPEIFKDARGYIVGVIVALSPVRFEASIRPNLHDYSEESLILHKSFDDLEEARYWIRLNTLVGTVKAA